jgi:hypothetical protein
MNNTYLLSLQTKELKDAVKNLHKLLNKIKPRPAYPILDVIVKLNEVELRLNGMSRIIYTNHNKIYSFTIPFHDLYAAALGTRRPDFLAEVSTGNITIANHKISSDYIKLFHPENLHNFGLRMDSKAIDILSLRFKFTEEELKEKNYLHLLVKEEENLDYQILMGLKYLAQYGISFSFLRTIIDQQIRGITIDSLNYN